MYDNGRRYVYVNTHTHVCVRESRRRRGGLNQHVYRGIIGWVIIEGGGVNFGPDRETQSDRQSETGR